MPVSTLPTTPEIRPYCERIFSDGKEHKVMDVVNELAEHFHLTAEDLNERLPSGKSKRFYTRCRYALHEMKEDGLIKSTRYAHWILT